MRHQRIELIEVPCHRDSGCIGPAGLQAYAQADIMALVIPKPNFFGVLFLEEADELIAWADANHVLTIAVVNPISLALLKPPDKWGDKVRISSSAKVSH